MEKDKPVFNLGEFEHIIIETDEKNPITIATIYPEEADVVKGYRIRFKPKAD